jgi:hypothetical protein
MPNTAKKKKKKRKMMSPIKWMSKSQGSKPNSAKEE